MAYLVTVPFTLILAAYPKDFSKAFNNKSGVTSIALTQKVNPHQQGGHTIGHHLRHAINATNLIYLLGLEF